MSEEESCVVRIVNLDEIFTKEVLKKFILMKCQPSGDIKNIYLKRENETQIFYGYVVFEHSYDAKKVTEILNGYIYMTTKFKVELIGPNLVYHIYPKIEKRSDEYYICCSECRGKHDSMKCPFVKLSLNREKAFHSRKVWAGEKIIIL